MEANMQNVKVFLAMVMYASYAYSGATEVAVYFKPDTKQRIFLVSDCHNLAKPGQLSTLVDCITSFPKKTTLVLAENPCSYPGKSSFVKDLVESPLHQALYKDRNL